MTVWEDVRKLVKYSIPASIMMPIIKTVLKLPPIIARSLVADLTSPTKLQQEWIYPIECDTWRGAWIGHTIGCCKDLPERIKDVDLAIYKAHGGAFRVGHCTMYMDVFIEWINLLKVRHNINALILSVEYSLAPEHTYPTPVLECVEAYKYLTYTLKVPGSKIILSGDSAGGALCLETLIRVYAPEVLVDLAAHRSNHNIELPAGLFLVSPLVSADISSWLWQYNEDMITPVLAECVLKEYLNLPEADTSELHILKISRIRSDFDRFLPQNILVYVGRYEVMRDDILSLSNAIKKDISFNVQVRKENYGHEWYFIREIVKARDKHILYQSDQQFVDFAVDSVKKSTSNHCVSIMDRSDVANSFYQMSNCVEANTHAEIQPIDVFSSVKA
ncbi:alpha/beta hydrolase fold-domain-containing protein [Blakeslea trispora]|nr:alpha/beta hydrolase fold-domain-containing protein [Blakeslea trispora]